MRLSKLHIAGFKSFPDRAELGFDHGVTAIVGPNGCGKSNVVDAITWVLGEQSAKSLRGERMEDVIFNGSDARKPTATAEVRLKLTNVAQAATAAPQVDDEPADESPLLTRDIEIGRRLYRSGESEYLIDGEVRRLRDVHDLLMDSGLGVKAYAVIEQGKIGQILASRPAERRMLIEEAAGVTKYKSRRRTAELKLDAAQQNLTRVDDIIFEVEKQRSALKRQASRARRYRRLREELRKWEQVQFARRHQRLSSEISAATARLDAARAREAAAAARVAELETALETVRLTLTESETRATQTREAAHGRELEIGRAQQQVQFDRQQIDELSRQAVAYADEAQELERRREPAALALAAQREALATATAALDAAAREAAAREADYVQAFAAVQGAEQASDAVRATVLAAVTTLAALRQARDNAGVSRDRVAAERERLEIEARDLSAEAERAQRGREEALASIVVAKAAHERALAGRQAAETELATRRAAREQAARDRGAIERELAANEARLRSLESLDASRATFGDAARCVLGEDGAALARHGAVADHLTVDRSYERAVDALLGDRLQYVVVDTMADVSGGLALLAARNAGRCGFLVLSEAPSDQSSEPLLVPPGARALADVVRGRGAAARAVGTLIGRALIASSFDAAIAIARTTDVPVATTAGDVFHGAWLVQGGSRQDVHGILETRAEIEALRELVEELRGGAQRAGAAVEDLDRQIIADESAVKAALVALHEQEKTIFSHEAQAARNVDEHARVSRRLDVVQTERLRADGEVAAAERRGTDAAAAIDEHQRRQLEAEAGLAATMARLQTTRDESENRMRLLSESRTAHATLVERVSGFVTEVSRLEEGSRELEDRIRGRRLSIERTEARRAELEVSIADTERRLDEHVRSLESLRMQLRDLDEGVASYRDQFSAADRDIRAARHALDGIRTDVTQSEVARATSDADLTHLGAACLETLGATIDEIVDRVAALEEAGTLVAPALPAAASDDDPDALEGEVVAGDASESVTTVGAGPIDPEPIMVLLRGRIDRLGPVNMMAIEQFDDLETRHQFLTTQRKDLLDSIQQTGEAIRKIDKTTRERFTEAFESINKHFEWTFTTLFGGGRAGLMLIDHENDTESGIDIIAQPPGKRLQNVQLLSGGEKALTAMALMFAIFTYRPSPFCLLDEIDAPLDDANIGRFVEMLQGMQQHTQFILITHNRKTMEIANRLYGVTMEEPGVSKLISVELN